MQRGGPKRTSIAAAALAACVCRLAPGQAPEVSPLRSTTVITELQQANDAVSRRDFDAASQHFTAALDAARSFEPTAQDYVAEAIVKRGEQRLDDARVLIQQALQLSPEDPDLYRSLGIIEEEAGSPSDAGVAYLQALRLKPDDVESAMYLWGVYEQLRDYQGAVYTFTELTAAAPENEFLQYYLGQAHFGNGSPELAVAALREAVRINPSDWANNRELLSALRRSSALMGRDGGASEPQPELDLDVSDNQGDVDQAVAEFERLASDPQTGVPTVKLVLATLYVDAGEIDQALPVLRQLALSQSLDMQLRYNVALNLAVAAQQQASDSLQQQLYAEAAEQFYRVLGLTDEASTMRVDVRIEYGKALVGAGKLVEALDELETAMYEWIELVPTRPTQLYFELGRAHYAAGEQDLAEENFRLFSRDLETYFAASVRGTRPDEKLEALGTLADIYFESGNYHSAAEVLKRAVTAIESFGRRLRIDSARTKQFRLQLARALLKEHDYPACIAELRKLQADPDVGHEARVLLAEAHLNQADPAKAVEQLQFVESSPGWDAAAMTLMGRALMASNDYQQAMTYLEQAQAAVPDDLDVLRLRAQCLALQRRSQEAEQIFNELLTKDAHSVEARLGLGDLAMQDAREASGTARITRYQRAFEHFEAAVRDAPTNSIALTNRDRAAELRIEAEAAVQAARDRSRTVAWVLFIVGALSIPAAVIWWQYRKSWARRMFDQVTTLERDLKRLIRRQVQEVWDGDWEKLAGDPNIAGRVSYRYLREKMLKADHPQDVLDVANFGHLVAIIEEGWRSLKFERYGSEPTRPLVIAALSYIGNCRNAVFHSAELDQKLNKDGAGRQQPVKHMNRQVRTSLRTVRENLRLALDQEPLPPSDMGEMQIVYATVVADRAP